MGRSASAGGHRNSTIPLLGRRRGPWLAKLLLFESASDTPPALAVIVGPLKRSVKTLPASALTGIVRQPGETIQTSGGTRISCRSQLLSRPRRPCRNLTNCSVSSTGCSAASLVGAAADTAC